MARIKAELDPYLAVRGTNGKIDWAKVRTTMRGHVEGQGSFILGLFLFELSRAVASGDRATIEAFFDGLATTRFWSDFGLFVVGAEAGTPAYTKFLQRFVGPSFVNTVLKSNVALATDMADPALWAHLGAQLGGGPGLLGFFSIIKEGLMRLDLPAATTDGLVRGNISRRLATGGRKGSSPGG